jgi:hypothetical protein
MAQYQQSVAYTRMFMMILTSDHVTGATSKTVTVTLSKAGGAFGAAGGTITEVSSGWYKIALTTTDTNTLSDLAFHCTATACDPTDFVDQVVSFSTIDAVRGASGTGIPNAAPGAAGGLFIAGTNAATTVTTSLTTTFTGNLTGSVGSVTGAVGSVSGAVGSVSGAVGSVTGNVGGNVTGSVGSLATQAKADVNAEVVDALATDTYAEPSSVPAATASIAAKIGYMMALARNKITQTATTETLRNDADSGNIATATVSDSAGTFTRGEWS